MKYSIQFLSILIFCSLTSFAQDSTVNNLVHPKQYSTAPLGQLGDIRQLGTGPIDMILLPGWGFDGTIFNDFMDRHQKDYRMFAVTFPGFGGTAAPPMPEDNETFSNLYWTNGLIKAINDLIEKEKLNKPVLVSCFTYSNIIAMRMALDHAEKVSKVVIVSGMAKFTLNYPSYEPRSLEARQYYVDNLLSKKWFKTVTKTTWDNGNFHPGIFTKDSIKAALYWEMMSSVPIPTMVRYLCEYYCTDLSLEYDRLAVPVLVVVPSFSNEFLSDPKHNYAAPFFHSSWLGAMPASKKIFITTIQDSNAFIMEDQPEKLDAVIAEFLKESFKGIAPLR